MEGGDLETMQRPYRGGDLKTVQRQYGGIFGLLGKLFGFGPAEMQKEMSDPIKKQMLMQRGGFPWALAGLSMLPMLMGKGQEDVIRNQMKTTRDPIMQRGGLSIPPALISKGLPLLKQIGIPLAMGALASIGDKVVNKAFGEGRRGVGRPRRKKPMRKKPRKHHLSRKPPVRRSKGRPIKPNVKTVGQADQIRGIKRKAKRVARNALRDAGRRLFEKANVRLESKPAKLTDTPFAKKLRESIQTSMSRTSGPDSSHISSTFNI
mgnify:CR=1 FL=1